MSLSSEEKVRLANYTEVGDRVGYYQLLADSGDAYANLALGVVNADTLAGAAANLFLVGNCGMEISSNELASLSLGLMVADSIARKSGISLGWREIQGYHNTAFNQITSRSTHGRQTMRSTCSNPIRTRRSFGTPCSQAVRSVRGPRSWPAS